ncbi:hypothetical protein DID88_006153 [Monilinia fructigena]|uniref:Uncharacterized protein n=1 Tax=Monilinia fructigena TaxID=38457 RepID=A0A395J4A1_9HELO|nr:hypothetical protein DID88_006153 [Monilinia fructigena]
MFAKSAGGDPVVLDDWCHEEESKACASFPTTISEICSTNNVKTAGQRPKHDYLPPSTWNNRHRISRLGIAPAPRAQSLQADQPPARTPTCLIPEGIKRRSQSLHQDCIVAPLAPLAPHKSLELKIPEKASTSTQPQATDSTPSSAISAHSESHIPEPSPLEQRFSPVAFAQIPSHFDLRHGPTPSRFAFLQKNSGLKNVNDVRLWTKFRASSTTSRPTASRTRASTTRDPTNPRLSTTGPRPEVPLRSCISTNS